MLDIFREKAKGVAAWIILLLIAIAFAGFSVSDYFSAGSNRSFIAKVNGQKVPMALMQNIYERVLQENPNADPSELKNRILGVLIERTAILTKAKELGLKVGDEQVVRILVQNPEFQVDGQFSKERYQKALAEMSMSDTALREDMSQNILVAQLDAGITQSNFIIPAELKNFVGLIDQKRDFGYFLIPAKLAPKDIQISKEEIQKYYEAHKTNFIKPEKVVLEYISLSLDPFIEKAEISKQEIEAHYNQHQASYTAPERAEARHILLVAPKVNKEADEKAKKRIEEIQARLKAGEAFAKLAEEFSEDAGTAKKGGDLGWFMRGQMLPEFEKVVFALKEPNSISEPVRTKYGYHLIQLVNHKNAEVRTLKEVQDLIAEQLKREKAQVLFAEQTELLNKLAFEHAKSLNPIAEQMGLKVETTEAIGREGSKKGVTANPLVLQAAFSDNLLKQSQNSDAIKIADNQTAVFRVKTHQPAAQETLAEAEKLVRERVLAERSKAYIKELGEQLVKKIEAGTNPAEIAKQQKLEWKIKTNVARGAPSPDINRDILLAAFLVPEARDPSKPNVVGSALANGDYLILQVQDIKSGQMAKLDPQKQEGLKKNLSDFAGKLEYQLYETQAKREAKIEVPDPRMGQRR